MSPGRLQQSGEAARGKDILWKPLEGIIPVNSRLRFKHSPPELQKYEVVCFEIMTFK